jgi:hypothetical protein
MICPSVRAISSRSSLKRIRIGGAAGSTAGRDCSPPITWRSSLPALRPIPRAMKVGEHHHFLLLSRIKVARPPRTNPPIMDRHREDTHLSHRNPTTSMQVRQVNCHHSKLLSSRHPQPSRPNPLGWVAWADW